MNLKKFREVFQNLKKPTNALPFDEQFAINRFFKKFEIPGAIDQSQLHNEAWDRFLATEERLSGRLHVTGIWYKVREQLHLLNYSVPNDIEFPRNSEFIATRGRNSIEAKLSSSVWTVTHDCWDDWVKIVKDHNALKKSFRRRYNRWFQNSNFSETQKQADKFLWKKLGKPDLIFEWKLRQICSIEYGSRFATVEKNNLVRRPINIECFGNTIVQKRLGSMFRTTLSRDMGIDLDTLQDVHRGRLTDKSIATIDLKDASDSIRWDLVQFLFPKKVQKMIARSRSQYILGADNLYHPLNKVSSMGNGFTFELMSLILNVLCRILDPKASVYGDDIIINKDVAAELITALESVGFIVNIEKSFTSGPFRESCGGNFHDDFGYLESYDFKYPENIHDLIVFANKAKALSRYEFFSRLHEDIMALIPDALHGPEQGFRKKEWNDTSDLPLFFSGKRNKSLKRFSKYRNEIATRYQYDKDCVIIHYGFRFSIKLRTPTNRTLRSAQYGKYLMYLHAGRVVKDGLTGHGTWERVLLCTIGTETVTVRSLLAS